MKIFIDDFSTQSNAKNHVDHVEETLKRYKKIKITLNIKKIYLVV